jgi:hypothetical protein
MVPARVVEAVDRRDERILRSSLSFVARLDFETVELLPSEQAPCTDRL